MGLLMSWSSRQSYFGRVRKNEKLVLVGFGGCVDSGRQGGKRVEASGVFCSF